MLGTTVCPSLINSRLALARAFSELPLNLERALPVASPHAIAVSERIIIDSNVIDRVLFFIIVSASIDSPDSYPPGGMLYVVVGLFLLGIVELWMPKKDERRLLIQSFYLVSQLQPIRTFLPVFFLTHLGPLLYLNII